MHPNILLQRSNKKLLFNKYLTEEGKKLYDGYMTAKNAWEAYVKIFASNAYCKRLSELGKKYGKYDYWGYESEKYREQSLNNIDTKKENMSDKTKKLYRKLSLMFHPDKYTKTDRIFIIITSYANNNEVESLEHIDSLSSEILDCPNDSILKLIELLGDKVKLVQLFTYMKENDNIINFINGNINESENMNDSTDSTNKESNCCSFLNTNAYAWFMGNQHTRKMYESSIYNEDELIEHLKTKAPEDELTFYAETSNNDKIIHVVKSVLNNKLKERNEYLKKDNEQLKIQLVPHIINKINELKTLDPLYLYHVTQILDLIDDTNKHLLEEKYDELLQLLYEKNDIYHYSIGEIFKVKHINIINHYIDCLLVEFNNYLELPPYHKKQSSYYLKIMDLLNKCFIVIYHEKMLETTNKVLDELVNIISNIEIFNSYNYSRFSELFKIDKIKKAWDDMCFTLIDDLSNKDFPKNILEQICESKISSIRTAGLDKVVYEKDKYTELYTKYYEC